MEGMYRQVPLSVSDSSELLELQREHNKSASAAFVVILERLQDIVNQLDDIAARIGAL